MKIKIITYCAFLLGTIYLESTSPLIDNSNDNTFMMLFLHLENNNKNDFIDLLNSSSEFNINTQSKDGNSILHEAIYFNQDDSIDCLKAILDKGANINIMNDKEISPLLEALQANKFNIAKFLIDNGADTEYINKYFIYSLIKDAIDLNDKDAIIFLIDTFFKDFINLQDDQGETLLDHALSIGSNDDINLIIKLLRRYGAKSSEEINSVNNEYDSEVESID